MAAAKKLSSRSGPAPRLPDEDRASPRYRLDFPLATADGEAGNATATVRDLSSSGMLVETAAPLALGSRLLVELPAVGTVIAEIVRQQDGLYGCEFRSHVPDSAVRETLRRSRIAWLRPDAGSSSDRLDASASAPEDVATDHSEAEAPARWPIAARLAFILVASSVLWALIILGLWVAIA